MRAFQQVQQQFIDHIKDPQSNPPIEDIEDRRMGIYRELFFNNVNGFVASGFPVLRTLFDDDSWTALVRDFFINHDCHSPYFIDISKEFLQYLTNERGSSSEDLPFLVELAHYEWVELNVSVRKELQNYQWIDPDDIGGQAMVLSETAWPLSYSFPVHQISVDFMPTEGVPGSFHLIVYRDVEDDVQFMLINGVTGMLLQLLSDNPGAEFEPLVQTLVECLPQFGEQQIADGAFEVMQKLIGKGIVRQFKSEEG
jgi:hypothetical protein